MRLDIRDTVWQGTPLGWALLTATRRFWAIIVGSTAWVAKKTAFGASSTRRLRSIPRRSAAGPVVPSLFTHILGRKAALCARNRKTATLHGRSPECQLPLSIFGRSSRLLSIFKRVCACVAMSQSERRARLHTYLKDLIRQPRFLSIRLHGCCRKSLTNCSTAWPVRRGALDPLRFGKQEI